MTEPSAAPTAGASGRTTQGARSIGLLQATGVGLGAIVGGGVLVLAGAAFGATGPSAVLAFTLNGLIALLTALTFAELSTSFPESGGAYTYAKKVLSVRVAFGVGWVLWFAYIVAGVLYALGFAEYAMAMVVRIWRAAAGEPPGWIQSRAAVLSLAVLATFAYALSLVRKASGGGQWATVGKIIVFIVLILAGIWVLFGSPSGTVGRGLSPFLAGGGLGLLQAMGFTFIALQGFEVIAAVAGEIKAPQRTLPRAMLLSLGAAMLVYLPLLFVVSTAGVAEGQSITEMSRRDPETVMATAVSNYLGVTGYWLVMVAAVLSTLSALQANILAASRVALSMARDRTLPGVLAETHATRGTPVMAVYATTLAVVVILLLIPDLAAAGAAASLIFLVSFALAHWTAWLARRRSGAGPVSPGVFRTPAFPVIPVVGGLACASMAVFQAVAVPAAGGITLVWLALGVILFMALFASRAQRVDAFAEAADPELVRYRGRQPLVLVPIANPASAPALVGLARALAPPQVGRVLLLSVVRKLAADAGPEEIAQTVHRAQEALQEALTRSLAAGHAPEALMTIAPAPWDEIIRVAKSYQCESLLIGLHRLEGAGPSDRPSRPGSLSGAAESEWPPAANGEGLGHGEQPAPVSVRSGGGQAAALERLLNEVDSDVTILRAMPDWDLAGVRRVVIPIGGKGAQDELRARLLGSLYRVSAPALTFVQVLRTTASDEEVREAERHLAAVAAIESPGEAERAVVRSDDVVSAIAEQAEGADLVILGLPRVRGRTLLGKMAVRTAQRVRCPTIMLSRRG